MEEELKQLIKEQKVIPFIGAGISIPVKYKNGEKVFPNWEGLLHNLKDSIIDVNEKNLVEAFLKMPKKDYLEIADKIEDFLPTATFNKKLKDTFDIDFNTINEDTLILAKTIWELGLNLVITTNYDKVLYHACDNVNKVCWDIQNIYEQAQSLSDRDNKPTMWHLHGHIDNVNNIVLSSRKYNELYTENEQDSKYPAALKTLRNKISSNSLLFIGFSLDDEYFVNELNKTIEIFEGNNCPHYVLCKKGSDTSKLNKNIIPIEYEDYGKPLIEKIKELSIYSEQQENIVSEENIILTKTHYLTILPPKNVNFIGRERELLQLEKQLSKDSMVYIVNGIGGVGKSELSYKYLHENKSRYTNVAFIEMTENTSIEELFLTKFKDELHLDETSTFDTVILRLQKKSGKNLLLIDNLEKKEDFDKLLPLNSNFDLLITTRIKNLDTKNQLPLDTLNNKDAKELFLSFFDEDENIEDILKYLDNHPLFINLTAKALNLKYITLVELRDRISTNSISKIDSTNDKTFEEHLQDTFNKQFVNENNDELKELLQYLSIFPSIELSFETLELCMKNEKLRIKLQKLVERGWLIQKDNSYKLHQIIKTFIETKYPIRYENITFIFKNIASYIDPYDSTLIASQLTHFINIIETFLNKFVDKSDNFIIELLDSICFIYYDLGQFTTALRYQEEAYELRERLRDDKSIDYAKSYNLLGIIYQTQGDISTALKLHEKSLDIRLKNLNSNHFLIAYSLSNIANCLEILNINDIKVENNYLESIKILNDAYDKHNIYAANVYSSLGLYYIKKKNSSALDYLQQALNIFIKELDDFHPLTAKAYNHLSQYYYNERKFSKAIENAEKSLDIREKIYGENHIVTAEIYNNLGVYILEININKAINFMEKSIEIAEENLEEFHYELSTYYLNIADAYFKLKHCKKTLFFIHKAIKILKKYDFRKQELTDATYFLKRVEKNIKKQKKAKFKDKGRFCEDT